MQMGDTFTLTSTVMDIITKFGNIPVWHRPTTGTVSSRSAAMSGTLYDCVRERLSVFLLLCLRPITYAD